LLFSVFSRLSAAFILQATRPTSNTSEAASNGVDEMLCEYMTALMLQARSQSMHPHLYSRSISGDASGGISCPLACKAIVPIVIDEIFELSSTTENGRAETGADAMLLHPIGDNRTPLATTQAHEEILQRDLDLSDDFHSGNMYSAGGEEVSSPGARTSTSKTVSDVVDAILQHRVVDEERGCRRVFTKQRNQWERYDEAAQYVLAQLRECNQVSDDTRRRNGESGVASIQITRRVTASEEESAVPAQVGHANHSDHSNGIRSSGGTSDETQQHGVASSGFSTSSNRTVGTRECTSSSSSSAGTRSTVESTMKEGGVLSDSEIRSAFSSNTGLLSTSMVSSSAGGRAQQRRSQRRAFNSGTSSARDLSTSGSSWGIRSSRAALRSVDSTGARSDTTSLRSFHTAIG
jgi:hypothetical protein